MAERSPQGSSEPGDRARPRRKKKKRKKAPLEGQLEAQPQAATEDGRPPFAAGFPRHPEIEHLLKAFEAGNFAYVRAEAPGVIKRADDEEVRRAARDLRRRIDPEPTSMFLWALGVALLVFLYGYYLSV